MAYDPVRVESFMVPPLCFYYLPGRESRPRAARDESEQASLHRPHTSCPFDTPDLVTMRGVCEIVRGEKRRYLMAINKFPVFSLHYLAIRPLTAPETDPAATLSQRIGGRGEIEDMLRLASLLGSPHRLFFNSNSGSDGSRSGSTVNHWHFQIFPYTNSVIERPPRIHSSSGGVERGEIPDWPAHHRLYRSADETALAGALWSDIQEINALDHAYNMDLVPGPDRALVALLFPRAPLEDIQVPGGHTLPGDFGGFELTGGVVVGARASFDWIRSNPEEARKLHLERLEASTIPPP